MFPMGKLLVAAAIARSPRSSIAFPASSKSERIIQEGASPGGEIWIVIVSPGLTYAPS